MNMKPKLIGAFLLVGLVPMLALGYVAKEIASDALLVKSFDQLEFIREIKKQSVERYISQISGQIVTFSKNGMIKDAMIDLDSAFDSYVLESGYTDDKLADMKSALGTYYADQFGQKYYRQNGINVQTDNLLSPLSDISIALQNDYLSSNPNPLGQKDRLDRASGDSSYSITHARLQPFVRSYLRKFGYYDIFLVDDVTGHVMYSVFKELDFATSLLTGPYKDTNFARAFRLAAASDDPDAVFFVDYERYLPSYSAPASFVSSPIFREGRRVGVAIFQMPIAVLNEIMTQRSGLGRTGESYLVGSDYLMRSDSYLDPQGRSVVASFRNPSSGSVRTKAVSNAISGESGVETITDYNGNVVLSAYTPVSFGGTTWSLVAEIDKAEVLDPVENLVWDIAYGAMAAGAAVVFFAILFAGSLTGPLRSVVVAASAVAKGDFLTAVANSTAGISRQDELGEVSRAVSSIPRTLDAVMVEVARVADAIAVGDLRQRGDSALFEGSYGTTIEDINSLLDELVGYLDDVPTPLMCIDTNGTVSYLNNAGHEMAGMQNGTAKGYKCYDVFTPKSCVNLPDEEKANECGCMRSLQNPYEDQQDHIVNNLGRAFSIRYRSIPNRNRQGTAIGAFVVVIDETEALATRSKVLHLAERAAEVSSTLASASEQLSAQVGQAISGARVQDQRTTETATAMEQMNATVLEVAKNAGKAAEIADSTKVQAEEGENLMQEMLDSMKKVGEVTSEFKLNMSMLQDKTEGIGHIIGVINDIADQTNLLALNAAIEAARAGEAGRGFAVVADEVRKLAEKTMDATREVKEAISDIQSSSRTTSADAETAAITVGQSMELAGFSGDKLTKIVEMAEGTADRVAAIATASEQQSATSEQINRSTEEVHRIAQQTNESLSQSAQAVDNLLVLAQQLDSLIKDMRS